MKTKERITNDKVIRIRSEIIIVEKRGIIYIYKESKKQDYTLEFYVRNISFASYNCFIIKKEVKKHFAKRSIVS